MTPARHDWTEDCSVLSIGFYEDLEADNVKVNSPVTKDEDTFDRVGICEGIGMWNDGKYCSYNPTNESLDWCLNFNTVYQNGKCVCADGWYGNYCHLNPDISKMLCHNHGSAQSCGGSMFCDCDSGWIGTDCSIAKDNTCSGHGTLISSKCQCDTGYIGLNCEVKTNEADEKLCSGHGIWIQTLHNGYCSCQSGFGGSDCSKEARVACDDIGIWVNDGCQCDNGSSGYIGCWNSDCNGHGTLNSGGWDCTCDAGWLGVYCQIRKENEESTDVMEETTTAW